MDMRTTTTDTPVFGHCLPPHRFRVRHAERRIDADALADLLHGTAVALHVHAYLAPHEAQALAHGFEQALRRTRADDVPAWQIGAGHYGKTARGYVAEVRRSAPEMRRAFATARLDLALKTGEDLQRALQPGQVLRTAHYFGCAAMPLRAAAWQGSTAGFALAAHEDEQQLRDPRQRGFEIQDVAVPVAQNVYVRMPPAGGALRVWNSQPSEDCKAELGVLGRGYPYRAAALEALDHVDVRPEAGDLVLLNGRFLHAVTGWEGDARQRIVYNGFMGLTRDACRVLRWS